MKKQTKNLLILIGLIIVIITILIASFVLTAKIILDQDRNGNIVLKARSSGGGGSGGYVPEVSNVIGTGYDLNSGYGSSTDQSTIFQFASTTGETYWNTLDGVGTPMFGTTPTAIVITDSDLTTFEIYYNPENNTSTAIMELFATNDPNGGTASSTLATGVEWYPANGYIVGATTSPANVLNSSATTTLTLSHDGSLGSTTAADEVKTAFTLNTTNITYLKVRAYNNSTTDGSLLFIKSIKK